MVELTRNMPRDIHTGNRPICARAQSLPSGVLEDVHDKQRQRTNRLYRPMSVPHKSTTSSRSSTSNTSGLSQRVHNRNRIEPKTMEDVRQRLKDSHALEFRERKFDAQSNHDDRKMIESEYDQMILGLTYDQLINEEHESIERRNNDISKALRDEEKLALDFERDLEEYELQQELEIADLISRMAI